MKKQLTLSVTLFLIAKASANPECFAGFESKHYLTPLIDVTNKKKTFSWGTLFVKIHLSKPSDPVLSFHRLYSQKKAIFLEQGFRLEEESRVYSGTDKAWTASLFRSDKNKVLYLIEVKTSRGNYSYYITAVPKGDFNDSSINVYKRCLIQMAKQHYYKE